MISEIDINVDIGGYYINIAIFKFKEGNDAKTLNFYQDCSLFNFDNNIALS